MRVSLLVNCSDSTIIEPRFIREGVMDELIRVKKTARKQPGECLYLDVGRFDANRAGLEAIGAAFDLVYRIWWPTKAAFVFDEEALAARLGKELPARGYTADLLRQHRSAIASFFTVLPDGRWAPSPEYFSLTDGNAEQV
jgi:hypothetical protein